MSDKQVRKMNRAREPVLTTRDRTIDLTKKEVREVSWLAGLHTALLSQAAVSFLRETRRVHSVYALDFDMIYPYLFPWRADTERAVIVSYILENVIGNFVLPLGTVQELVSKVNEIWPDVVDASRLARERVITAADGQKLDLLIKLCRKAQLGPLRPKDLISNSKEVLSQMFRLLRGYDSALGRLCSLLERKNFQDILEFFDDPATCLGDPHVREAIYTQLTGISARSNLSRNNRADAQNLATVIAHHQQEMRKYNENPTSYTGTVLQLLTTTGALLQLPLDLYTGLSFSPGQLRSPLALDLIPTIKRDLPHSLLLVTPSELLYRASLEELSPGDYENLYQETADRLSKCKETEGWVIITDSRLRTMLPRAVKAAREIERIQKDFNMQKWSLLGELNQLVLNPVFAQISKVIAEDTSVKHSKRILLRENTFIEKEFLSEQDQYCLDHIDELSSDLQSKLRNTQRLIEAKITIQDLDPEESRRKIATMFNLEAFDAEEKSLDEIPGRKWRRYRYFKKGTHLLIFGIEMYEEYYSVFWPTTKALDYLVGVINDKLLKRTWTKSRTGPGTQVFVIGQDRNTEIIKIRQNSSCLTMPKILWATKALSEKSTDRKLGVELPRQVRIVTSVGQFAFDITSDAATGGRYVSVISDADILKIVTELFDLTSHFPLLDFIFQRTVNKKLSHLRGILAKNT